VRPFADSYLPDTDNIVPFENNTPINQNKKGKIRRGLRLQLPLPKLEPCPTPNVLVTAAVSVCGIKTYYSVNHKKVAVHIITLENLDRFL